MVSLTMASRPFSKRKYLKQVSLYVSFSLTVPTKALCTGTLSNVFPQQAPMKLKRSLKKHLGQVSHL